MVTKLTKKKRNSRKSVTSSKRRNTFPDSDTFSLDITIADFIAPRLKRLRAIHQKTMATIGFADISKKEWLVMLDAMIFAWNKVAEGYYIHGDSDTKVEYGLNLFRDYMGHLWW